MNFLIPSDPLKNAAPFSPAEEVDVFRVALWLHKVGGMKNGLKETWLWGEKKKDKKSISF